MRGFTLVELLLSVACIGVLFAVSMPIMQQFLNRNDRHITAQKLATTIRRANVYARTNKNDSQWGINITPSQATIYRGATFALRDTSYDEVTPIPSNITVAGLTDVNFSKMHGVPNTTGNITVSSSNQTETITINAKGLVSY